MRLILHSSAASASAQQLCLMRSAYLFTLFKQKFQFSVAGLNGDLHKIIRINNQI